MSDFDYEVEVGIDFMTRAAAVLPPGILIPIPIWYVS
jgi:hypothetical protein